MVIRVIIDGEKIVYVNNEQQPLIRNQRTMVPVHSVFEKLGFKVVWIPGAGYNPKGRLRINNNRYHIVINEDEETFTINGRTYYHPHGVPAQIIGGRVMILLRELLEQTGHWVGWDSSTHTVYIYTVLSGYFKIKNADGKYLTYVGKSNNPITVESANDAATQIWKIERSSEGSKYHIRPAKFDALAMNVYRKENYPCTIQPTAGNIEDTSFSIERVHDLNVAINWGGTHYLTESSDKAYWTETDTPQEWTLEPTSYTPPPVEYYHIRVLAKATGMPIKNATVCMVPVKTDTEDADLEFFTTDEDGRVDIAAMGEQENVNYKSVGFVVHADGYADWSSEECTLAPSSNLTVELKAKSEYPDYSLPLNNISGPIRANHRDFGWRYLESIDYHTGIDLGNNYTSDKIVKSICDGTVVEHDFKSQAGNYVMVKDDKGYYITYMHLASHTDFEVDAANRIVKGARIGIMSNTVINGDPTKDQGGMKVHLHISIGTKQTIQKSARTYLDPKAFLPF